ncbi:MAG: class E sortase [Naasia sp.]
MKTESTAEAPSTTRRRISPIGVLGELLVTAGVLVLLFLGWQLWWNDWILAGSQTTAAEELSREWHERTEAVPAPAPSDESAPAPDYGAPVVAAEPDDGDVIANLYVPRFGEDYVRTIAQGTGTDVLNSTKLGIGHYPGTQMPGDVGNFAIAAHRSAYGGGMHLIDDFRLGDPIVVETPDGWYTYRFTNLEYVLPTAVSVLDAVPQNPEAVAGDRVITLTSCNPLFSTDERIIAYGVLESWQPASAGRPAVLDSASDATAGGR